MNNSLKPMLNTEELINKLRLLGIRFNIINEEDAKHILSKNTYYFKLGYYRTNFPKKNNKYNIEFAYLSDLASIDMRLRYLLIIMCLDIEHIIKTEILHDISENPDEDGYTIMSDFYKSETQKKRTFRNVMIKERIEIDGKVTKKEVPKHEFKKYYDNPPIWVCFELISYNQFNEFLHFYQSRFNNKKFFLATRCIGNVRKVRNISAHNQPLLVNLHNPKQDRTNSLLMNESVHEFNLSYTQMKLLPIRNISAVFLLHKKYCHKQTIINFKDELISFQTHLNKNAHFYNKKKYLKMTFSAINKIIDSYIQ
ncbi:Abi family protein [Mammaliicoccus sciuri]|uniref:Abi family protein n=1 Tax=Mammaliicoccus sciuri TaxID=1296 RepID=UPI001FB54B65|nr:Abi family protein [Mammaliicoccus sciuri]MCJ0922537.1 Abi family protein [Mammaliicoccus sciuri]